MSFRRSMPVFGVTDIESSLEFYKSKLGFSIGGVWGTPPSFAIVGRDLISIGLDCDPDNPTATPNHGWSAYLYVDDAETLIKEYQGRDVVITTDLHDTFYGCREFDLKDPDGNRIAFATDLQPGRDGPGL